MADLVPTRHWKHDCPRCRFLGNYDPRVGNPTTTDVFDLYACLADPGVRVLARFGDNPAEYSSMPMFLWSGFRPENGGTTRALYMAGMTLITSIEASVMKHSDEFNRYLYAQATRGLLDQLSFTANRLLREECVNGDLLDPDLWRWVDISFQMRHSEAHPSLTFLTSPRA